MPTCMSRGPNSVLLACVGRRYPVSSVYYLLAVAEPRPALFSGIAWSTASALAATVERAGTLGLSVRLLEPLRDIDTLEDLRAERAPGPAARPLTRSRRRGGRSPRGMSVSSLRTA